MLPVTREPETLPGVQRPRSWAGHRRDLPGGGGPGPRGQWLVEDGATFRLFQGGRLRGRGLDIRLTLDSQRMCKEPGSVVRNHSRVQSWRDSPDCQPGDRPGPWLRRPLTPAQPVPCPSPRALSFTRSWPPDTSSPAPAPAVTLDRSVMLSLSSPGSADHPGVQSSGR